VNAAVLADGQNVSCDLVVAGIGVRPVTEFLDGSGIEVADGVRVNEYLETNQRNILAAGDVANYQDVLFGKRRRAEHWDNAVSQGQYCARALMGERTPFKHVPYFGKRPNVRRLFRRFRRHSALRRGCRGVALRSGGAGGARVQAASVDRWHGTGRGDTACGECEGSSYHTRG
jgi:NADPH-dependent 2,4-dienoyl-CoA reductase/sulfur reductase-like enzyme